MSSVALSSSLSQTDAEAGVGNTGAVWGALASASTQTAYSEAWLTLLCQGLDGAVGAILLLASSESGPFVPAAVWPDRRRNMAHLTPAAERALRERRGTVSERADPQLGRRFDLAYPVEVNGRLRGVTVVEVGEQTPQRLQESLRDIHWGMASLEVMFHRQDAARADAAKARVFAVLDLVAVAVEESRFQSACTALVSELASRLDCDRVSLGFRRGRGVRVHAISHNATFGREMNLVRLLESAMEESLDQQQAIRCPGSPDSSAITAAHRELARQQGGEELCTVPIAFQGRFEAALTLERPGGRPLDDSEVDLCETLGGLVCPILLAKRDEERWLVVKAWLALRDQLAKLFGPSHLIRKLLLALLVGAIAFFSLATGPFRLAADATVEGGRLRAIVAPFNGYIADARFRAGNRVSEGDLLAVLDDRDLNLEQIKLTTQRAQYQRERREASADHDRARARILSAQIEQAEAQLALIREQLARTRLTAPYDGVLVSGDLSRSLGSPVQRGDLLFEIAPVGSYRLMLQVDERDLSYLREGASGAVILGALPETAIPFRVTLITPVTAVDSGRNAFEVEAALQDPPAGLRPGMEGIGKIDVGEARLIWIWTRTFQHWLRVKLWSWLP